MIQYPQNKKNILSLFSYMKSQYMIKSLLFRKQSKVETDKNSALIIWGPSLIIGGVFSEKIFNIVKEILKNSKNPYYIYLPENDWETKFKNLFAYNLIEKQINLYKNQKINKIEICCMPQNIVPINKNFFELKFKNTQVITDEFYSYLSIDDFLQNGFGLALIIDNVVIGYCLSEYSIDNECAVNIWIHENYRQKGYARIMAQLFLEYCMERNWNVYWGCFSDNLPSNKMAISSDYALVAIQKYFEYSIIESSF